VKGALRRLHKDKAGVDAGLQIADKPVVRPRASRRLPRGLLGV